MAGWSLPFPDEKETGDNDPKSMEQRETTGGIEAGAGGRPGGGAGAAALYKWHKRCTSSSSWKSASSESAVLGWGVMEHRDRACAGPWLGRPQPPGLHVSGEVQCVPLQFREGDGGVLQVVEEDLDLCHDVLGPDVSGGREVRLALHLGGSQ